MSRPRVFPGRPKRRRRSLFSLLKDADPTLWARGAFIGLPLEGAAAACSMRGAGKLLALLPTRESARTLVSDLRVVGRRNVFLLEDPPLDAEKLKRGESLLRRGRVLSEWRNSADGILAATPAAIVSPFRYAKTGLVLSQGKTVGRDTLTAWLAGGGYIKTDLVWRPGEFASRGGIVDFYDPSESAPVRVEFFDEEIDSIRFFQPRTQRSYQTLREYTLRRAAWEDDERKKFVWEGFRAVFIRPKKLEDSYVAFRELYNALVPEDRRLKPDAFEKFLLDIARLPRLRLGESGEGVCQAVLDYSVVPYFKGDLRAARAWMESYVKAGYRVHVTSRGALSAALPREIVVHGGASLSGGAVSRSLKEAWVSDAELFGINETVLDEVDSGMPLDLESSLRPGQWVVHEKYGVCRLAGSSYEKFGGQTFETVVLRFADSEKLLIPASELYRLTPWNGEGEPEADALGSKRWRAAWKKAEERIEAEAQGLLNLYAVRETTPGRAFAADGEMLRRFEETFPYKETRDQLRAISDVKSDMRRPWPMDRLIVGDVGYGKTEIVLRAAVKAVENGAQAAVVAPTTILALQHFRTCKARVGDLPVRVELLTRMIPKKRQREILKSVARGEVDILIGTHRLFQDDIDFKDLGLLVIDEEHRLGVRHKERLKERYPGIDVLSLSATPIPRSLSMALRGIRDISVVATPPRSRGEVFTVTSAWDASLAYDAVLREMSRGGQVYYLHNRVEDIGAVTARLANRFPDSRVAYAHGRMDERELENVMNAFYEGKIDILVCTTIIESGLDVPRANTLIVDDARYLGLAQMHQIRGRIGRRSENAYALFFYQGTEPPAKTRERLEAFGSALSQSGGYQLAQRDLEIRGAGEILGTEQHGFKQRIGYALYLKKLRERVEWLRGGKIKPASVRLSIPLAIPPSYVPQDSLRIGLYRRLLTPLTLAEYDAMREELADRYGPIPEPVECLLGVALLRGEGGGAGIEDVSVTPARLVVRGPVPDDMFPPPEWIAQGDARLGAGGPKGLAAVCGRLKNALIKTRSAQKRPE